MDGGLEASDLDDLINENRRIIRVLEQLKTRILNAHTDYSISRTVGASVSAAGAVAAIGGILLAPFTAGLSLGLTAAGVVGTVGGTGTVVTTGIIEQVKTKEWAGELKNALECRACVYNRIGDKILRSKEWLENALKSGNASSTQWGASNAIRLSRIMRFLEITAPEAGVTKLAGLMKLAKLGSQIGASAFRAAAVGLNIFAIAIDIHTIVDTWTTQPELVSQIDTIKSYIENQIRELQCLRNEFR